MFGDRLTAYAVLLLVVFGVTYIVGHVVAFTLLVILTSAGQRIPKEQVVNFLAVLLVLIQAVGEREVTDKLVNHCLKDDVEVLGEQELVHLRSYAYMLRLLKESIAKLPQFKSLVREILVFYLTEATYAETLVEVLFEPLAGYKVIVYIEVNGKTILRLDVMEYGIENDEQFLIEVDLSLLCNRVKIDRFIVLYNDL